MDLMSKIASIFRLSLSVAVLLLAAPPAVQAADVKCSDKQISARGPGFEPSPELSMEAAKKEWLKKATEVYSDATVQTARDPQVMCASQGLYSNCTITGFPCGTKPVAPKGN
jgi:hypothetical protein